MNQLQIESEGRLANIDKIINLDVSFDEMLNVLNERVDNNE